MKILLGPLLFAFVVFINYDELNAVKPPARLYSRHFEYAKRAVLVWDDQHGIPIHLQFAQGSIQVTRDIRRDFAVKVFLEFANGIYFFVTTIDHEHHELIARVDIAPFYNRQGFPEPGPPPVETGHMFGREVSIFCNQHNDVTSVRFSDRNIVPSEIECRAYQIKYRDFEFLNGTIRVFRLKRGYHMGIHFYA